MVAEELIKVLLPWNSRDIRCRSSRTLSLISTEKALGWKLKSCLSGWFETTIQGINVNYVKYPTHCSLFYAINRAVWLFEMLINSQYVSTNLIILALRALTDWSNSRCWVCTLKKIITVSKDSVKYCKGVSKRGWSIVLSAAFYKAFPQQAQYTLPA